jgi:uncharacterized protein YbaR (Trm112 family)
MQITPSGTVVYACEPLRVEGLLAVYACPVCFRGRLTYTAQHRRATCTKCSADLRLMGTRLVLIHDALKKRRSRFAKVIRLRDHDNTKK